MDTTITLKPYEFNGNKRCHLKIEQGLAEFSVAMTLEDLLKFKKEIIALEKDSQPEVDDLFQEETVREEDHDESEADGRAGEEI